MRTAPPSSFTGQRAVPIGALRLPRRHRGDFDWFRGEAEAAALTVALEEARRAAEQERAQREARERELAARPVAALVEPEPEPEPMGIELGGHVFYDEEPDPRARIGRAVGLALGALMTLAALAMLWVMMREFFGF